MFITPGQEARASMMVAVVENSQQKIYRTLFYKQLKINAEQRNYKK
jgi:hypothetical protein